MKPERTKNERNGCFVYDEKTVRRLSKNFWPSGLLLAAQYGYPGNGPGFMKVAHELLGITKGTGHFQIEPAGMNAQPGGSLLVLFAERSSCHVLIRSFHYPKLEKVKKVIGKAL